MKNLTLYLAALLATFPVFAQVYDDVYFSPKDEVHETVVVRQDRGRTDTYRNYGDDYYDDSYYDDNNYYNTPQSESYSDGQGNTYITNNYYGDNFGNDYTTRMRRFYQPCMGFGYFSPMYTGMFYDPWMMGGWGGGFGVGIGWGSPWMMGPSWGWGWDPWFSPWRPWYGGHWGWNRPWGSPWGGWGYGSGYWAGYNHGYWNGYYDGMYGGMAGGGLYGGGFGNYGRNTIYGPRQSSTGIASQRNTIAEKQDPYVGMQQPARNTVPVASDRTATSTGRVESQTPGRVQQEQPGRVEKRPNVIASPDTRHKQPIQRQDAIQRTPSQQQTPPVNRQQQQVTPQRGPSMQPNNQRNVQPQRGGGIIERRNDPAPKGQPNRNLQNPWDNNNAPRQSLPQRNEPNNPRNMQPKQGNPNIQRGGKVPQQRNFDTPSNRGGNPGGFSNPSRGGNQPAPSRGGNFSAPSRGGSFSAPSGGGGGQGAPSRGGSSPSPRSR